MRVFVDTSAFLAIMNADDQYHAQARGIFQHLIETTSWMTTTNYVVVETVAILQARKGLEPVRDLIDNLLPMIDQGDTPCKIVPFAINSR